MAEASDKRVLVTGATGFVGRVLTRLLTKESYNVIRMTRPAVPAKQVAEPDRAPSLHVAYAAQTSTTVQADLLDTDAMTHAMAGVDTVYHLASLAHVYGPSQAELRTVIVDGTRSVLNAALQANVRRLVYFSSILAKSAADGDARAIAYGEAKWQAEKLLQAAQGSIEIVILRPVNVFGPGMQGNLRNLIAQIASGRLPPLPALPTRMALIAVQDLARAALLAAEAPDAAGKTYAVSDGHPYTLVELEAAIYRACKRKKPTWRTPRVLLYGAALGMELLGLLSPARRGLGLRTYRNLVTDHEIPDASIQDELGFKASTNFYQDLPALVADIQAQASAPAKN